jgi:hypothetical protein
MVVLESTIMFRDVLIVEKMYPAGKTGSMLNKDIRDGLLMSLTNLAKQAFHDELESVNVGDYQILQISKPISPVGVKNQIDPLSIYTIADIKTNKKDILKSMEASLTQFLNRYSIFDLYNAPPSKFAKFGERLEKIFGSLIFTTEERLRSVF